MKILNSKLVHLFRALKEIGEIEKPMFSSKAYYAISRNMDLVESAIKTRDKELLRIYKDHGAANPRMGFDGVSDEQLGAAQDAVDALDAIEVDIEFHMVKEEEFNFTANKVKGSIVAGLMPILLMSKESVTAN